MKKVILFTILLVGIAALGFLALRYAGAAWQDAALYNIQENSNVITLVKRNIFAVDCPCLVFQKGTLYHGQDTFEVIKFNIVKSDLSWNVVSNRLVTLSGGRFNPVCRPGTADYGLPQILGNLADDNEQMIGEFRLDQTSVYVTTNTKSSRWYMYLVGSVVPTEQVYLIAQPRMPI